MTIRDRIKELRRVPARDLIPNAKNWRKHPERQRKAMTAVLGEIGYADALLARETADGKLVLIDGHLRAEVTPDTEVPVLVLDVTPEEADKILATLDPLAGMAEIDAPLWTELLAGIEAGTPDFEDLLQELRPDESPLAVEGEDLVPDLPEVPVSQPGDLWVLGTHRVLCGDSTKTADVARLLNGVEPGLAVADPPYGVLYDPHWRAEAGVNKNKGKMGKVRNDDRCDWRAAWALFPGSILYVWHAGRYAKEVAESIESSGFELRSQIIWAKDRFALSRGHYHWQHEPCWYAVRSGSSGHWSGDRSQTTLWQIKSREDDGHGHGTQKPVECMRRPIVNHTNIGQSVYDPFLGSGTTLIAAETSKRVCYGVEISPAYCDVIVKRWQTLSGQIAKLESDSSSFDTIAELRGKGNHAKP